MDRGDRPMTATITEHVARFVETKQTLGYRFTNNEQMLRKFCPFRRGSQRDVRSLRDRSRLGIGIGITE